MNNKRIKLFLSTIALLGIGVIVTNNSNFNRIHASKKSKVIQHKSNYYNQHCKAILNNLRATRNRLHKYNVNKRVFHSIYQRDVNRYPYNTSVKFHSKYLIKVCCYYHIKTYIPLMAHIMQLESNGQGNDLMQSSESAGLKTNTLGKADSIIQAARYIKDLSNTASLIDESEHSHSYKKDMKSMAQAYNFGPNFLYYLNRHNHSSYSLKIASKYSKSMSHIYKVNKNNVKNHHIIYKVYCSYGNYRYGSYFK